MDPKKAIFIIETLANGIDPVSGEVLPDSSPYNNVEVVRALHLAAKNITLPKKVKKTPQEKQNENIAKGLPKDYGLSWDEEAKKLAVDEYRAGKPIEMIAGALARKPGSVVSMLLKEGVITPEKSIELKLRVGE